MPDELASEEPPPGQLRVGENGKELREEPSDNGKPALGVLFVHGIGAQVRGQTLSEFGEPICRWLEDRFDGLDRQWLRYGMAQPYLESWRHSLEEARWKAGGLRASLATGAAPAPVPPSLGQIVGQIAEQLGFDTVAGHTTLADACLGDEADPRAPAHARLSLYRVRADGRMDDERWLLAESWWAEAFSPPRFSDLGRWGLGIVPWTIGSHFGAQVRRCWTGRPKLRRDSDHGVLARLAGWTGWLLRLLGSLATLAAAILLSFPALGFLVLLLLLAVLPIARLRSAVVKLQEKIAATLGDSYVLISRPIEAASIIGRVRRDLAWLSERCEVVAVVAHSQGGAVVHEMLRSGAVPSNLGLVFTFGSGLRKLEELRRLQTSAATYRRSAALTMASLPFVAFGLFALFAFLSIAPRDWSRLAVSALFGLPGLYVLAYGISDHLRGIDLPELKRWLSWLQSSRLRWVDCYASADPVTNGRVLDDEATRCSSRKVYNRSSALFDHTTYWSNRDHFVSLLIGCLAEVAPRRLPELATDGLGHIARRRQWRVGVGSAIGWIGATSAAVAIWHAAVESGLWARPSLVYAWHWLLGPFGSETQTQIELTVPAKAVALLALVLAAYGYARLHWRRWDLEAMRAAVERLDSTVWPEYVTAALWLQLLVAAYLVLPAMFGGWIAGSLLLALCLVFLAATLRLRADQTLPKKKLRADPPLSEGEGAIKVLSSIWNFAAGPFVLGAAGWSAFAWLTERFLGGSIGGFEPGATSGLLVGGLLALACIVWAVGSNVWRSWRERSDASG